MVHLLLWTADMCVCVCVCIYMGICVNVVCLCVNVNCVSMTERVYRLCVEKTKAFPVRHNLKKILLLDLRMKVRVLVTSSCLTLCDPLDCSPPGSSVRGILQARIPEWLAIPFPRRSSWPRDRNPVSCIAGRFFTIWAIRPKNDECWNSLTIKKKKKRNSLTTSINFSLHFTCLWLCWWQ